LTELYINNIFKKGKAMPTAKNKPLEIVIYRFTGRQFFFNVPQQWCEECDMTIGLTRSVLRELGLENDRRVRLVIKPWMVNVLEAFASGGWHPPVLLIDNQVFSQGVVPDRQRLKALIERRLGLMQALPNDSVAAS
jgi:hypothetical protein